MVGRRNRNEGIKQAAYGIGNRHVPYVSNINAYEFIMKPERGHYLYSLTATLVFSVQ
jgi:urease accessory protein UreE